MNEHFYTTRQIITETQIDSQPINESDFNILETKMEDLNCIQIDLG